MKKIIAIFITLLFLGTNSAMAFSEVYYLKNTTVEAMKPVVKDAIESYSFRIIKENPYYAQSVNDSSDYAVIILQQSGNNMFYYYNSNDNKKINKKISTPTKRVLIARAL